MDRPVSLIQALRPRAIAVAAVLAPRLPDPGPWTGYRPQEGLTGRLRRPQDRGYTLVCEYSRPGHPGADLQFGFLVMTDIKEEHRSDPIIVRKNVIERYQDVIKFAKPIEYSEVIRHTFSRTVTEQEASKTAWEVAAKASLGVEFSGVKASLEVSAKYGRELSRQSAQSQTVTDEVTKSIKVTGPVDLTYEAVRSLNREQRIVTARCDFDAKLYFQAAGPWEWYTYRSQFLQVAQGLAPDDIEAYQYFIERPPADKEIQNLTAPSDKTVQFVVDYDNVVSQELRVV